MPSSVGGARLRMGSTFGIPPSGRHFHCAVWFITGNQSRVSVTDLPSDCFPSDYWSSTWPCAACESGLPEVKAWPRLSRSHSSTSAVSATSSSWVAARAAPAARITSRRLSTRRAPVRAARKAPTVAVSAAGASDVSSVDDPLSRLRGVSLKRATDGETVDAASIVPSQGRVVVPFLTQFADFDSWELAQRLVDDIPALDAAGVTLVAVGIGSVDAAREFATRTNFPLDRLYSDDSAAAYDALGFAPGFGREGGAFGWIGEKLPFVNGYAKLLVMCAGVGSPGTLAAVFGGYFDPSTATRSSSRAPTTITPRFAVSWTPPSAEAISARSSSPHSDSPT